MKESSQEHYVIGLKAKLDALYEVCKNMQEKLEEYKEELKKCKVNN